MGEKIIKQPSNLFILAPHYKFERCVVELVGVSDKITLVGLFVMLKLVGVNTTELGLAERHPGRAKVR